MSSEIKLGVKVRDEITGLTGIVTSKVTMLDGTHQWTVQPFNENGDSITDGWNIDPHALTVLDPGIQGRVTPTDPDFNIEVGMEVEDTISGLTGKVVRYFQHFNGCVTVSVQQKCKKDGELPESIAFDWKRLRIISPPAKEKKGKTGGPSTRSSSHRVA